MTPDSSHRRSANVCPTALLLAAIVACRGDTGSTGRVSVRDSAGVTMVEAPSDPRQAAKWSVKEPPQVFDAGKVEFYRVRGAGQFADGGFVIAHEGLNELRFYSANGTLQHTVGRQGSGPLEFLSMDHLETLGDSVWVAYTKLIIDAKGNLWAAVHGDDNSPKCWHVHVVAPHREFAEVCLPNRFTLLDVRSESLIGILRDDYDVEQVARYDLVH
jgi:hypothetical protein